MQAQANLTAVYPLSDGRRIEMRIPSERNIIPPNKDFDKSHTMEDTLAECGYRPLPCYVYAMFLNHWKAKRAQQARRDAERQTAIRSEQSERERRISAALDEMEIPDAYRSATLAAIAQSRTVAEDAALLDCYEKILHFAENLKEHLPQGKGLYLYGEKGRYKTRLATAVLLEAAAQGTDGLWVSADGLIQTLWGRQGTKFHTDAEFERKAANARLLVIDDLGAERDDERFRNTLESVVSARYDNARSIIFTTNLSKADFNKRYSPRIVDRIKERCAAIEFKGESRREAMRLDWGTDAAPPPM